MEIQTKKQPNQANQANNSQLKWTFKFEMSGALAGLLKNVIQGQLRSDHTFNNLMNNIRYMVIYRIIGANETPQKNFFEAKFTLYGSTELQKHKAYLLAALASLIRHFHSKVRNKRYMKFVGSSMRVKTSSLLTNLTSMKLTQGDVPDLEKLRPLFSEFFKTADASHDYSTIYLLWVALFCLKGYPKEFHSMADHAMKEFKNLECTKEDELLRQISGFREYETIKPSSWTTSQGSSRSLGSSQSLRSSQSPRSSQSLGSSRR